MNNDEIINGLNARVMLLENKISKLDTIEQTLKRIEIKIVSIDEHTKNRDIIREQALKQLTERIEKLENLVSWVTKGVFTAVIGGAVSIVMQFIHIGA